MFALLCSLHGITKRVQVHHCTHTQKPKISSYNLSCCKGSVLYPKTTTLNEDLCILPCFLIPYYPVTATPVLSVPSQFLLGSNILFSTRAYRRVGKLGFSVAKRTLADGKNELPCPLFHDPFYFLIPFFHDPFYFFIPLYIIPLYIK